MKISIMIPVYNVADYLEACVASVLKNDCDDCEVLLVDDGSTDGASGPLCDRLAQLSPGLIRVIHQENRGLGGARNTGVQAAQGEYILFLDSDDTLTPDALATLKQTVSSTCADVVVFHYHSTDGAGTETFRRVHSLPLGKACTLEEYPLMLTDNPTSWARLWKKSLFAETGVRFPEKQWYEDLATTPILLAQARCVYSLDQSLYRYLERPGSIMRSRDPSRNGEIMGSLEQVLRWYDSSKRFGKYAQELCYMTLLHLYDACYRVLMLDEKSNLLPEMTAFLRKWFPDYTRCAYYKHLPKAKRLSFYLMSHGQYALLGKIFQTNQKRRNKR